MGAAASTGAQWPEPPTVPQALRPQANAAGIAFHDGSPDNLLERPGDHQREVSHLVGMRVLTLSGRVAPYPDNG